ncbi:MAG: CsbD family protein [Gemmatimonadaceae bacterium]
MNQNTLEGNWTQLKGKVKEQWGKLTDDDLDVVAGKRDQLVGRLQERYGKAQDEVEREVDDFTARHVTPADDMTTSNPSQGGYRNR